ncbi:hypothetical protein [Streptomyces sp. NPDC001380]|uniref:hypothetical protein n=1 Tax=Streptomyces sp. NPDC001380 TaxID=3364566 RepID=UPI00367DAE5B
MQDWLYILDPTVATMDGRPSSRKQVRLCAETAPRAEWWLTRRRLMSPGDRLWIYFSAPEKVVAAMADVTGEPYEVPDDTERPWRVRAVLHREATLALDRDPVPLAALTNRHPQGVTRVKEADLELLMRHARL